MDKHILIVEDEPDIREAISEAITESGFRVSIAENGSVGLRVAIKEKPDLILLDIIMPIMDGHEMLKNYAKTLGEISQSGHAHFNG